MAVESTGYDLIGDIHGHASELKELLKRMGYHPGRNSWKHPERTAIFVGDYIDRGPEIPETLEIVRSMQNEGAALAIMGNHEYNALAFHYHHPDGGHIRRHSIKNMLQHYETLRQFRNREKEWEDQLAWMANLPMFLDLGELRVVHACWHEESIDFLQTLSGPLTRDILLEAHRKGSALWRATETVLKGSEISLPDGHYFIDKDGNARTACRSKWWLNPRDLSLQQYLFHAPPTVAQLKAGESYSSEGYGTRNPPVFFGHYWLDPGQGPALQAANVCCLDYSVAKGGNLVAYRYRTGEPLDNKHFVFVESV